MARQYDNFLLAIVGSIIYDKCFNGEPFWLTGQALLVCCKGSTLLKFL